VDLYRRCVRPATRPMSYASPISLFSLPPCRVPPRPPLHAPRLATLSHRARHLSFPCSSASLSPASRTNANASTE
jgi:hypothetical protein